MGEMERKEADTDRRGKEHRKEREEQKDAGRKHKEMEDERKHRRKTVRTPRDPAVLRRPRSTRKKTESGRICLFRSASLSATSESAADGVHRCPVLRTADRLPGKRKGMRSMTVTVANGAAARNLKRSASPSQLHLHITFRAESAALVPFSCGNRIGSVDKLNYCIFVCVFKTILKLHGSRFQRGERHIWEKAHGS